MRVFPGCVHVVLVGVLAACAAPPPPPMPDFAPRPVRELGTWDIAAAGRRIGSLVLIEIDDPREKVSLFQVRNEHGQWLGAIDRQGRVWQRVPFEATEVFRGAWPLARGVAMLCEAAGEVDIVTAAGAAPPSLDLARPAPAAFEIR